MKSLSLVVLALGAWVVFALYMGAADIQCHLGHVPWPLTSC